MAANYEAVVLEARAPVTVRPSEKYQPGDGELLIRATIVTVNPFEAKMQKLALRPTPYPASFGIAFAGTVETVGAGVTRFTVGDSVVAFRSALRGTDLRRGAHQRFVISSADEVAKVGHDADPQQTASIILNMSTVVAALSIKAGLNRPSRSPEPKNKEQKVLIYGGTTQLGRLSIQYARSAGYSVVTTTSPRNADDTASLSPAAIVDHTKDAEKVSKELIELGPYVAVFDTASLATTQAILAPVLRENATKGLPNIAWAVSPAQKEYDGVEFRMNSYPMLLLEDPTGPELKKWLYEDYFPGCFSGVYSNAPTAVEKVPGGLKSLQSIYDRILNVSGRKLVYSPWDE